MKIDIDKASDRELQLHVPLSFLDFFIIGKETRVRSTCRGLALRRIDSEFEKEILLEIMKTEVAHIFGKEFIGKETQDSPMMGNKFMEEDADYSSFVNMLVVLETKDKFSPQEKSWIPCISRVYSLVPASKSYGFLKNCYDYDGSHFLSIVQATRKVLRGAFEAHLAHIFLSTPATQTRPIKAFHNIIQTAFRIKMQNYQRKNHR